MALNIAFFGSSLVSAYWNGAATYYRGVLCALARRGHRITFYEPDAYDRQKHRDIDDPDWAKVVVYPCREPSSVERVLDEARSADLVVKASGVGIYDDLLAAGVASMKAPRRITAYWDVDAPATLAELEADPDNPLRRMIPMFDLVLTYGGGKPVVDAYGALGARQCVPIYNALDPDTHYPVAPEDDFLADLSFLGNRLPDREARVEEYFLRAAECAPDHRFVLGGSGWGDKELPLNVSYVGHVYTRDHNAFNVSATTVLNVSRDSMARMGYSPATRVFEAAGAAACLITDEWEGIGEFFEPERELMVARSGAEVAEYVRWASREPEQAKAIGRAAYRRALADHTYDRRVALLEDVLGAASRLRVAS